MKQSTVKEFCVSDYRRTIKLEYRIYFALIFLISIPLATFTWLTYLIMNIFNSKAKTKHIIPVDLTKAQYKRLMDITLKAHKLIGCAGVTRSDFKFYKNKFYLLF